MNIKLIFNGLALLALLVMMAYDVLLYAYVAVLQNAVVLIPPSILALSGGVVEQS
jgi:hypothetical protein